MRYLIDGYNLLYAVGLIRPRLGPDSLEKARLRLLGMVKGALGEEAHRAAVVFDGAGAPAGVPAQDDYEGVRVYFATRPAQADDLIEGFIARESVPAALTVVSDDRRIRDAARRRHCPVLGCLDFMDELARERRRRTAAASGEKDVAGGTAEVEHWLKEFGGLETDPQTKPFFEMDRFEGGPGGNLDG